MHVASWSDVWLRYTSHVLVFGVHIVYIGHLPASAVLGEVSHLPAVEAWTLGAFGPVILLSWDFCHIAVLGLCVVGIGVVILILPSIIGGSGA